jgi:radical SAM protein with 4Fe4S-binding SPASM domain
MSQSQEQPLKTTDENLDSIARRKNRKALEAPKYCVWEITLACDLGCKHCGSRAGKKRQTELTTAECLDVVSQLDEMGFSEVTLIGGEAYLREDWDIIAREIVKRGMLCGITTGGRAFTEERVKRAEDAGISHISVSIDGLEKTHDAQRGASGSWRDALKSAERISKTKIKLSNNTQINRLSLPELPALSQLLVDTGSKSWQIQITVPMGKAGDRTDLLLQPYDLLTLYPILAWIKENRLQPNGIRLFPGNNIGYFGPYEELLRYGGGKGTHWEGCGAGKSCIGIEADGKIKGCPSLPSDVYTGGYTQEARVEDVIMQASEVNHIKQRTKDDLWGYCQTCYYADICKGGCTWTAHCTLGKAGNNPYCIHRALDFESKGLREKLVPLTPPPGKPFDFGTLGIEIEQIPQSLTEDALILGHPIEKVLSLSWQDVPSIWQDDQIEAILKKDLSRQGLVQIR